MKAHCTSTRKSLIVGAILSIACCWITLEHQQGHAQQNNMIPSDTLRSGKHFIPTRVYSLADDQKVLKLFDNLRVTDVTDGMDKAGLQNIGLMSPEILPLWKDYKHFNHRIVGIAVTVRYLPTNKAPAGHLGTEEFDQWVGNWYSQISPEPFMSILRPGSVLVFDDAPDSDVGTIGSNNIMQWKLQGCVGVITNCTARDTDEIAAQGIPLYYRKVGRGIRPGRNEIESVNRPIECGGVLVEPGDVIVADGDGVIVVPRARAREVAVYAGATLDKDKSQRRELYRQLDMELDESVR